MNEGAPKEEGAPKYERPEYADDLIAEINARKTEVLFTREGAEFVRALPRKYPETYKYCELYHVVAGSSVKPEEPCTFFDFEGDDSIEQFFKTLVE